MSTESNYKSNPLKSDPELKELLTRSDTITSTEDFDRWKQDFLSRLDFFLEQKGVKNAEESYADMSSVMDTFVRKVAKVDQLVVEGKISKSSSSVRGRNAINEVSRMAKDATTALVKFLPASSKEEEEMGYNKYQLGAVLVRDGFEIYETICMTRDLLKQAKKECLDDIAGSAVLEHMDLFFVQIVRFCDVMADLGLYELMIKAHKSRSKAWKQERQKAIGVTSASLEMSPSPMKQPKPKITALPPTLSPPTSPAGKAPAEPPTVEAHDSFSSFDDDNNDGIRVSAPPVDATSPPASPTRSRFKTTKDYPNAGDGSGGGGGGHDEDSDDDTFASEPKKEDDESAAEKAKKAKADAKAKAKADAKAAKAKAKADAEEERKKKEKEDADAAAAAEEEKKKKKKEAAEAAAAEAAKAPSSPTKKKKKAKSHTSSDDEPGLTDDSGDGGAGGTPKTPKPSSPKKKKQTFTRSGPSAAASTRNQDPGPPPGLKKDRDYDEGNADRPPRPDLRVRFGPAYLTAYNKPLKHDDCVLVPEFFGEEEDLGMYDKLMKEITELQEKNTPNTNWIPSGDGKHMVCLDPSKSATFKQILMKVSKYWNLRKGSVGYKFNYYRNSKDIKPLHHDLAACDEREYNNRPLAVTASFGCERELCLEAMGYPSLSKTVYVPLGNNSMFALGRDVNIRFAHSILGTERPTEQGRFSIMVWGYPEDVIEEENSPKILDDL